MKFADRMDLPGYPFSELERNAAKMKAEGTLKCDLSIGDPDLPPPAFLIDEVRKALEVDKSHRYPSSRGDIETRKSVARWYKVRFGVDIDPETEVCILIGAKEGLGNLARAYINSGDKIAYTEPCYPVYWRAGGKMLDAKVLPLRLNAGNDFLPNLDFPSDTKLLYLNYPNNPTGAEVTSDFLKQLAGKIETESELIVAYDMAYSEVYFNKPPPSILEYTKNAVEFHSLSKMANATGYRVGFAAGHADYIQGLCKVKEEVDSGVPYPFQRALSCILDRYESSEQPEEIRHLISHYGKRRENMIAAVKSAGYEVLDSNATFYVWFKVDDDEMPFIAKALEAGVLMTPGSGFGTCGKGWARISVTASDESLERGMRIIQDELRRDAL